MTGTLERPPKPETPRFAPLLGRMVLAGLLAGALAGVYSLLVTERAIAPALRLEEARAAADGGAHGHGGELFGRGTQLVGGFLGTVLAGVVLAVVFAAVYALVRHRLPGHSDLARVCLLAAIGFGIAALLPAVAMPANPPAVGDPATVETRTATYGAVLLSGIVSAMLIAALVSYLQSRGLTPAATAAAAVATSTVLLGIVLVLVPGTPEPIAPDVPAALVWNFRVASLGQLAVLWTTLGIAGGWLIDRSSRPPAGKARTVRG